MTRLALIPKEKTRDVLLEALGADPAELAGIAELIRDEVSARGACPRAATIRNVCRFAAPAANIEPSAVAEVCDLLEREGDLVLGAGGILFATPIRAVALGNGTMKLVSSLSTRGLAALLTGSWSVVGTSRTCTVDSEEQAWSVIAAAGGVVLTPSEWACLDRVPRADERWLEALDRRLKAKPEAAGSLERDEPLAWGGFVPTRTAFRWKADDPDSSTCLWRARNRWGRWHFAWTQQGTPQDSPFVSLRPDEGARTAFAVARMLGIPAEASIIRHDQEVTLSVPHWLPRAEYRFLAVSAAPCVTKRDSNRWSIPINSVTPVLEVLRERLGLVIREETGI